MRCINYTGSAFPTNSLAVTALDTPQPGFANTRYEIAGFNTAYNPHAAGEDGYPPQFTRLPVIFNSQAGNYSSDGVTLGSLLAICCDRLNGVQHTLEARPEYGVALSHLLNALEFINQVERLEQTN